MYHTEKSLWDKFSLFIRLRDSDERGYLKCISCNTIRDYKEMDAGHYINVGECKALKYNEDNVNGQCTSCNRYKSGSKISYRINLVEKIGEKKVKNLEITYQMKRQSYKLSQLEIDLLYEEYKNKVKDLLNKKFF